MERSRLLGRTVRELEVRVVEMVDTDVAVLATTRKAARGEKDSKWWVSIASSRLAL